MWKNSFIFFLIIFYCTSSLGTDSLHIILAKNKYNESVSEVGKVEVKCQKLEVILDKHLLSHIKANKEQLKTALIYYHFNAIASCTREAVKNYLLASAVLTSLDSENSELYTKSNELIVTTFTQLLETQANYEALPDGLKDKLSDIEALHSPFNLIKSAEALGLM
jgi:macrodomain Ter protein organizer (MatP/YcbG family)